MYGAADGRLYPPLRNLVHVTPLVDATFPLSGGLPAFEKAGTPGVMKVLLDVETPETGGGGFSG